MLILCIFLFQLDTLKIRAYGVKNPMHAKEQPAQTNKYYRKDRAGNYDEWGAVLENQVQTAMQQE